MRNFEAIINGIKDVDAKYIFEYSEAFNIFDNILRIIDGHDDIVTPTFENYIKSLNDEYVHGDDDPIVLTWLPLLVLSDISSDNIDENLVSHVLSLSNSSDETKLAAIEYVRLLHDIYWNHVDKSSILEILPELDILENEVVTANNVKDTLFAALWCFIWQDDYESIVRKAYELDSSNPYICITAGALAGVFYD